MRLYRIQIKPNADPKVSFAYCLDSGVLGLGYAVATEKGSLSWEEYEALATQEHGKFHGPRYLKKWLMPDDLIWARSPDGPYYLARATSGWEYKNSGQALEADIVNIFRCDFCRVPTVDFVPGKVIASFRPGRQIQEICDDSALQYSMGLWNELSGTSYFDISGGGQKDIFSFLDDEETEDVVFLYLQSKGWLVVPNSRKTDTKSYEYYLIDPKSKRKSVVQVKTGGVALNRNDWVQYEEQVFLFQSNGIYEGDFTDGVTCLSPEQMKSYMYDNTDLMPNKIRYWIDYVKTQKVIEFCT